MIRTILIININNKNQICLATMKNYEQDKGKYIHFSIDDVIDIFSDITHNTDYRIEQMQGEIKSTSEIFKDKNLIIFTHEWILNNENKNKITEICKYGTQNGYIYKFPEKI